MRNKTTNIYTEWLPLIDNLSDQDAGKIFKYILKYQSGEEVKSSHAIWLFIKQKVDDYNDKMAEFSQKQSDRAKKRWDAVASGGIPNYAIKTKEKKIKENKRKEDNIVSKGVFFPPTTEDVKEYCKLMNYSMSAEEFVDHYESNGWKVGKVKMISWLAAIRNWERRDNGKISAPAKNTYTDIKKKNFEVYKNLELKD